MSQPAYSTILEAAGTVGDDRVRVIETGTAVMIAVADGAGGIRGSAHAAEAIVRDLGLVVERGLALDEETIWTDLLIERIGSRH